MKLFQQMEQNKNRNHKPRDCAIAKVAQLLESVNFQSDSNLL